MNRHHQKPDKADAHNKTGLTEFKFSAGLIDERVSAFHGFFARRCDLLESISTERMHICARLLQRVPKLCQLVIDRLHVEASGCELFRDRDESCPRLVE